MAATQGSHPSEESKTRVKAVSAAPSAPEAPEGLVPPAVDYVRGSAEAIAALRDAPAKFPKPGAGVVSGVSRATYGPLIPEELLAKAQGAHAAVAMTAGDDAEFMAQVAGRAADRRDHPHRFRARSARRTQKHGPGGGELGAEAAGGQGNDGQTWRPVRERFFHTELGVVLSGLPPGERVNTVPPDHPLHVYPVSPLPTTKEEALLYEAECSLGLIRAAHEYRREQLGQPSLPSPLGLSRVGEPWYEFESGEHPDMPDGGFVTGNFSFPPKGLDLDPYHREGGSWEQEQESTPAGSAGREVEDPVHWFVARPVLLAHMHRLGWISSLTPSYEELAPLVFRDGVGCHQLSPASHLRNNAALRNATTWLAHGFVFHKDAAAYRRAGLRRLRAHKEIFNALAAAFLRLLDDGGAGGVNGMRDRLACEEAAAEEEGQEDDAREQGEVGATQSGTRRQAQTGAADRRATTLVDVDAHGALAVPSSRWSLREAIDAVAAGRAGRVEVGADVSWSPDDGAEIVVGAGGEEQRHKDRDVRNADSGGGRVVLRGLLNMTRARRVPELDRVSALDPLPGEGPDASIRRPLVGVQECEGGGARCPPVAAHSCKAGEEGGRHDSRNVSAKLGGAEAGSDQEGGGWDARRVLGAQSLEMQEQNPVFYDGFHYDDDPPGLEGGWGEAAWGCERSWRTLPSLHAHPTHNGVDRGLPRLRGGWIGGGVCDAQLVRLERVPRNCTPDLLPENEDMICLRVRGAWLLEACEVVSCHGTAVACEGRCVARISCSNLGGITRNPRYWASYALNASHRAVVDIDETRVCDTMFGGLVVGGSAAMRVLRSEFVRNEPSLVIQQDGLMMVDRCGFGHHNGEVFQTLAYGAVGMANGAKGSVMEIVNSRDVLGSRFPWAGEGRPTTLVARNNSFDCRTEHEYYEEHYAYFRDNFPTLPPSERAGWWSPQWDVHESGGGGGGEPGWEEDACGNARRGSESSGEGGSEMSGLVPEMQGWRDGQGGGGEGAWEDDEESGEMGSSMSGLVWSEGEWQRYAEANDARFIAQIDPAVYLKPRTESH